VVDVNLKQPDGVLHAILSHAQSERRFNHHHHQLYRGASRDAGNPAYGASKTGALGLTRNLGDAWARDGIRSMVSRRA